MIQYKNIYLKIIIINKKKINFFFYNNQNNIFLNLYIINLQLFFNLKFLKKFLYENGIKNILLNYHYKIGLKYNYLTNLLKI